VEEPECRADDIGIDIAQHTTAAGDVVREAVGVARVAAWPEHFGIEHPAATEIAHRIGEGADAVDHARHARDRS
jgi:hypothetical protein